jgi:hypothetical protein
LAKAKNLISKTTPEFWQRYALLPKRASDWPTNVTASGNRIRSSARFDSNFKQLEGHPTLYSARVGIHYRAIAQREGDLMIGFGSVIIRNTTLCFASGVDD